MINKTKAYTTPPTYFHNGLPPQFSKPLYPPANVFPGIIRKPMMEYAMIISVVALSFFAIDNYKERKELESKLHREITTNKNLQDAYQKQVNAIRRKRELQILNERKQIQIREMKMSLHIALLRNQLMSKEVKPISIEETLQEYEKCIKMENSLSNVSGTMLWVDDNSPFKAYVPNVREYDLTNDGK